MKNLVRGIVGVIFCLLLFGMCPSEVRASEEKRIVRVGYIDYDGFIIENHSKGYEGYGVEYLEEISRLQNWECEYILDTWENHMQSLKNGSIDLICTAQKTPERETAYGFSKAPIGVENNILYVLPNEPIYFDDFDALDGKRVGLLEGSYQTEQFDEYAEESNFSYQPVLYETETDIINGLNNGEVDVVAVGSLARHKDLKIIGRFGSAPFYFMTNKEDNELLGEIDHALEVISVNKPMYTYELYEKYYGNGVANVIPLITREEHNWIENHPVIRVGFLDGKQPLSWQDETTGECKGILVDILELLGMRSGLSFEFVPVKEYGALLEGLKQGEFDSAIGIHMNAKLYDEQGFVGGEAFLEYIYCLVGHQDTIVEEKDSFTVAVARDFAENGLYDTDNFPNWTYKTYNTLEEKLQAVLDYNVNGVVQNIYIANYALQNPKYDELVILPTEVAREKTCLVVNEGDDIMLSIIDKTLDAIEPGEIERIANLGAASISYERTWKDNVYYYGTFLIVIGILLCLIAALVCYLMVLKRKMKNYGLIQREGRNGPVMDSSDFLKEDILEKYNLEGRKILVAEDDSLSREIVQEFLGMIHAEVVAVKDGKEAIDAFLQSEEGEFSVILLDIFMPLYTGHDVARMVRNSGRQDAKTIPIIALSANSSVEDMGASLNAGMNAHIAKPFDALYLFEILNEQVKKTEDA